MNLNSTDAPTIAGTISYTIAGQDGTRTAHPPLATTPQGAACSADWAHTMVVLGAGLYIHVYFFIVVYSFTAIVSLARLYKLYTFRAGRLMSGFQFKMNMHISTLIFSLLRIIGLLLDPYGTRCRVPLLVVGLLWSLAFPCLAVALSLLLLVLLETTKLYPNWPCIRHRTWTLALSTTLYTTVLVLKDVLHTLPVAPAATIFNVLSLTIFAIWGLIMMLGYFYVARKIRNSLRTSGTPIESGALRRFSGLLLACGSVGIVTIMMQIFSAVTEYGFHTPPERALASINPWVWWCLQSAIRTLESAMSCLLMLVASRIDNKRHVNVAPAGTIWEWPRMHGWSLEAAPARPGRPIPKPPKCGNDPEIPAMSTTVKTPRVQTQEL